jgi:hypothetical protein
MVKIYFDAFVQAMKNITCKKYEVIMDLTGWVVFI